MFEKYNSKVAVVKMKLLHMPLGEIGFNNLKKELGYNFNQYLVDLLREFKLDNPGQASNIERIISEYECNTPKLNKLKDVDAEKYGELAKLYEKSKSEKLYDNGFRITKIFVENLAAKILDSLNS
ncbi:Uncharacterised protein [Candidatus Tiddalikarchaeum anstoanum]|nr:Uncharacterised protein [Candidatus Tiddalikarchaeum anstoanum]